MWAVGMALIPPGFIGLHVLMAVVVAKRRS